MIVCMVTIEGRHYNVAQLQKFHWFEGRLYLTFVGQSVWEIIADPNRRYYEKVCEACLVRPVPNNRRWLEDAES